MGKCGVLLMNVGTPDEATVPAVKRYLKQFLMDGRVVDLPYFLRLLLVRGIIVPFRAKQSTKAYQAIWDEQQGSPLLHYSQSFVTKLQSRLGNQYHVVLGMRYGNPNIQSALLTLEKAGIQKIILAPLYPQYASASTGTALEDVLKSVSTKHVVPDLVHLGDFYDDPGYIQNQASLIAPKLSPQTDCVLFSYHGLPFSHIQDSEQSTPAECQKDLPCPIISTRNQKCYRAQCYATSRLLAKTLDLTEQDYVVAFQSRVGMNRWIGPDTEGMLKKLIGQGKKHIVVACPSFVTDCLETIEEIGLRAKELWQSLGGETFELAPCLNDQDPWVANFAELIENKNIQAAQQSLTTLSATASN